MINDVCMVPIYMYTHIHMYLCIVWIYSICLTRLTYLESKNKKKPLLIAKHILKISIQHIIRF